MTMYSESAHEVSEQPREESYFRTESTKEIVVCVVYDLTLENMMVVLKR